MTVTTDYALLLAQADALTEDEPDTLANFANVAALLYHNLAEVNWCGFYLKRGEQLVLGPFQGQSACTRIDWGKGVCGGAAQQQRVLRVADVHDFPGHIACDAASESEIVLPLLLGDRVVAVLDIDSPVLARFSAADEAGLGRIARLCESLLARESDSLGLTR